MTALELRDVEVAYGGVPAVRDLSLTVEPGEIVGLIGPNGAGKSTTLHAIMGLVSARAGEIRFGGKSLRGRTPEAIARAGIALVPEGRRVFPTVSIADNLRIGGWANRRTRGEITTDREAMYERFPILGSRRKHAAASLSGGEAQMLAVAMALMARPRLIVLDEPSLGLAPMVVDRIMEEVARLRDTGVSVLLVEQNVRKALKVVDRAYIVSLGVVHMSGTAAEMQGDADVRNAYLGSGGTPTSG